MSNNPKTNTSLFSNNDLKEMQSYPLERKIAISLTKIAEFKNKFPLKIYILRY
jgi:hypothetical protein